MSAAAVSKMTTPSNNEELIQCFDDLLSRVAVYSRRFPDVEGMDRLLRAVGKEREVALNFRSNPQGNDIALRQGVDNNFRGLQLEFQCAASAPGVVAVRKRFATRPPSVGAKLTDAEVVEVDVVAQDGLLWIECKAEKGIVSPNVVPQALGLQKMAKATCNRRHFGTAPKVAVYLTGTLVEAEDELLREAGIQVIKAGSEGFTHLPPVPPPPVLANLDITALFALVSEVSNGGVTRRQPTDPEDSCVASCVAPEVREWAARKPQHAACLEAELEQPLNLADTLREYERLIAHPSVVERFEKILTAVGGPRERRRWRDEWSARIHVTETVPSHITGDEDAGDGSSRKLELGVDEDAREARRRGVRGLTRISEPQLMAFELGEVEMAKTFTANSRAVTLAAEQGVFLEVYVFKAIWLVGL